MTELSPLGTLAKLNWAQSQRPLDAQRKLLEKQGRVICGVDMRIVGEDGHELPWDGVAFGELQVRGPWVIDHYFRGESSPLSDGWFPTGDVATIDPDGFLQITDRSKDVIKSGGEWISSIDIENVAIAHPGVAEAACIACAHPNGPSARCSSWCRAKGEPEPRRAARVLRRQGREMVDSRRRRVRRIAAAHRDRQAAEAEAARDVPRLRVADGGLRAVTPARAGRGA